MLICPYSVFILILLIMFQKNLIIEILESASGDRTYIVRSLPSSPNETSQPVFVANTADELVGFFSLMVLKP